MKITRSHFDIQRIVNGRLVPFANQSFDLLSQARAEAQYLAQRATPPAKIFEVDAKDLSSMKADGLYVVTVTVIKDTETESHNGILVI